MESRSDVGLHARTSPGSAPESRVHGLVAGMGTTPQTLIRCVVFFRGLANRPAGAYHWPLAINRTHLQRGTSPMRHISIRRGVAFVALLTNLAISSRWVEAQGTPKKDAENCFLWKVSSKTASVYLLGTMHVSKP